MQNPRLNKIVSLRSKPEECLPEVVDIPANVPVLPETLLSLELKMGELLVDLIEVAAIVRSDPGAAVHVMNLAGREASPTAEIAQRIEDCISILDLQQCFKAMSEKTAAWTTDRAIMRGVWEHAREIAQLCRALAAESMDDTNPEDAYMVGLFHELGSLPGILEWNSANSDYSDEDFVGLELAKSWSLPTCVQEYFSNRGTLDQFCKWSEIVGQAHRLSSGSSFPQPQKSRAPIYILQRTLVEESDLK